MGSTLVVHKSRSKRDNLDLSKTRDSPQDLPPSQQPLTCARPGVDLTTCHHLRSPDQTGPTCACVQWQTHVIHSSTSTNTCLLNRPPPAHTRQAKALLKPRTLHAPRQMVEQSARCLPRTVETWRPHPSCNVARKSTTTIIRHGSIGQK